MESELSSESGHSRPQTAQTDGHFGTPAGLDGELLQMARDGRLTGLRSTRRDLVQDWLDDGLSAEETCRRLTAYNRLVIQAVLEAHAEDHPWLRECSFLEFGSGGRDEQVVGSDQDNGLLVAVDDVPDDLDDVTQSIVVALDGAGLPLCDGGVMASNEAWRGDFDTWLARLTGWLSNPAEKGSWQSGLILDFTGVFGPQDEVDRLRQRLWEYVRTKPIVLSLLVGELTDYKLPLTIFGSFITEREGPWHGFLNIKNSVLAHLTNSARILALKYNIVPHNTCERIRAIAEAGHVSPAHGQRLLDAWNFLQRTRLEIGLACDAEGVRPHNYVNPTRLVSEDRARLKAAIQATEKLVRLIQAGAGL
jgi:CBS domain-containing protein